MLTSLLEDLVLHSTANGKHKKKQSMKKWQLHQGDLKNFSWGPPHFCRIFCGVLSNTFVGGTNPLSQVPVFNIV